MVSAAGAGTLLQGRTAIVTGAESGIGAATAAALGRAGANVAVWYWRDTEAAARTCALVEHAGARARAVEVDVRDERSVDAAATASREVGVPSILVNCAGLNQSHVAVSDMSGEQWRRLIDTDLTGAFYTCRRFIRDLRQASTPGAIVNITSIHAEAVRAGAADYDAAKAGLRALTRTLALECAPLDITVNDIAPGMILTPMNARAETDAPYRAELEANIPLRRAGTSEEVAALAVYLVSPAAAYITGATVTIDGGLSLVLGQGA